MQHWLNDANLTLQVPCLSSQRVRAVLCICQVAASNIAVFALPFARIFMPTSTTCRLPSFELQSETKFAPCKRQNEFVLKTADGYESFTKQWHSHTLTHSHHSCSACSGGSTHQHREPTLEGVIIGSGNSMMDVHLLVGGTSIPARSEVLRLLRCSPTCSTTVSRKQTRLSSGESL